MPIVVIGCRLPNGLKLNAHDKDPKRHVTLNGQNKDIAYKRAPFIVLTQDSYGLTEVDEALWKDWKARNKDFPALHNGALFEAKTHSDAEKIAEEVSKEKTGFEGMPQTMKQDGLKPVESTSSE